LAGAKLDARRKERLEHLQPRSNEGMAIDTSLIARAPSIEGGQVQLVPQVWAMTHLNHPFETLAVALPRGLVHSSVSSQVDQLKVDTKRIKIRARRDLAGGCRPKSRAAPKQVEPVDVDILVRCKQAQCRVVAPIDRPVLLHTHISPSPLMCLTSRTRQCCYVSHITSLLHALTCVPLHNSFDMRHYITPSTCVKARLHMCHVTHSCDSLICVTYLKGVFV